jgi:hypothetical protein
MGGYYTLRVSNGCERRRPLRLRKASAQGAATLCAIYPVYPIYLIYPIYLPH